MWHHIAAVVKPERKNEQHERRAERKFTELLRSVDNVVKKVFNDVVSYTVL